MPPPPQCRLTRGDSVAPRGYGWLKHTAAVQLVILCLCRHSYASILVHYLHKYTVYSYKFCTERIQFTGFYFQCVTLHIVFAPTLIVEMYEYSRISKSIGLMTTSTSRENYFATTAGDWTAPPASNPVRSPRSAHSGDSSLQSLLPALETIALSARFAMSCCLSLC